MINALLTAILNLIMTLVSIVLSPIDALISTFLPDLSSVISKAGSMFNYALSYVNFLLECFGIHPEVISFIVLFYSFKLVLPFTISLIKSIIKWYDKLKP